MSIKFDSSPLRIHTPGHRHTTTTTPATRRAFYKNNQEEDQANDTPKQNGEKKPIIRHTQIRRYDSAHNAFVREHNFKCDENGIF